jgi:sensor c-di-GMP phosphodiesterase-like protein
MQRSIASFLFVFLVSIVFAVTCMSVVSWVGIQQVKSEQYSFSERYLAKLAEISTETTSTLIRLNRSPNVECNTDFLIFLRQIMFQATYIKDIGYFYNDRVQCTTGLGIINYEVGEPEPDFTTSRGYSIWTRSELELFQNDYSAFATKLDRFNIITDQKDIAIEGMAPYRYQIVYSENGAFYPMLGEKGLYQNLVQGDLSLGLTRFGVTICDKQFPFCIATVTDIFSFISTKVVMLWLFLFGLFCFIGYLLFSRAFEWYYSVPQRVKRGLKTRAYYPLFQPIVCLHTGRIIGCEMLARFKDSRGVLYPDEFIPMISQLKLTKRFTARLMAKSLALLDKQQDIPSNFKINFNVFPCDINEQNVEEAIRMGILKSRFAICFELTEDEALDNAQALSNIDVLREQGVQIAIDDFGTGYANLGQLQKFHFDTLKIDRSFVISLEEKSVKSTLIPYIVSLAKQLEVEIVAEGIETRRQQQALLDFGVEQGQGWLFGKPMDAEALANLMKGQKELN